MSIVVNSLMSINDSYKYKIKATICVQTPQVFNKWFEKGGEHGLFFSKPQATKNSVPSPEPI